MSSPPATRTLPVIRRRISERRVRRRTSAAGLLTCQVLRADPESGTLKVLNISPWGIAIVMPHYVLPGEVLSVLLRNRHGLFAHMAEVRVTHCRARGTWFIAGGPFLELLSPEAFRYLLV
jgi:hypothetical protein